MATLTAYASSFNNAIPTGFNNQLTTPANAQGAPDGTNFATDAVAGLHTGGNHYYFADLATIPAGSTINSVTVSVNHAISTTTRGVYGYRLDSSPNTQIANEWVPTSANAIGTPQTNATWSTVPSLAQLQASTFGVRARYQRTATQAVTYSLDAIAVIVDYTPPSYEVRVSFPTPTSAPSTGAGLQEFRALVRKKVNDANNPLVRLELWESGALKSTVLADTAVTSTTGQVLSATWDASTLTTASGANVECKVVGTNVGGNAPEVGAIEWNKYPEDAVGGALVGRASPVRGRYGTRATLSVSYPLTGRASPVRGSYAARATLSASYPLSGRAGPVRGAYGARGVLGVTYALASSATRGRSSARASSPVVSYALSGVSRPRASARAAAPAVAYPLAGRAVGRARVRAATSAAEYAVVGASSARSSARGAAPAVSYALLGRSSARSGARATLAALYALTGRATGRSRASYTPSGATTDVRVGFDTPTSQLVAGTSLQEFRVQVRKTAGSGIPSARIELWEAGSFVATVLDNTDITDETTQVISVSWDAALLSDISGAGVECRVVGEPDVAGGTATVEVGAIEWNAFTANPQFALIGRASSPSSGSAYAGVNFALSGNAQGRSSARSVSAAGAYSLVSTARARSSSRASLSVVYALSGRASGRALARSVTAATAYPLVGVARGRALSRSSAPAVSYPLVGRASGRARVSALTGQLIALVGRASGRARTSALAGQLIPLVGRAGGRASARSAITFTPGVGVLAGRASVRSRANATLSVRYALTGRASGRASLYLATFYPLVGRATARSRTLATLIEIPPFQGVPIVVVDVDGIPVATVALDVIPSASLADSGIPSASVVLEQVFGEETTVTEEDIPLATVEME